MKNSQSITVFDLAKPPEVNAVGRMHFPKGWHQRLRVFFDYELIFMLDGEVVYIEEGEEIRVRPGEVILLSPYRINSSLVLSKPAQTIFLHFKPGVVPRTMSRETWHRAVRRSVEGCHPSEAAFSLRGPVGLNRWMQPAGVWHRLLPLLEAAIQEKQGLSPFGRLSASLCAAQVLLLLSRSVLEGNRSIPVEGSHSQKLTHRADAIIQDRYADGLNVEGLARLLGVTPQYLIRTFQAHRGETPLARIHRVRLTKAQELLTHTELSIKEISDMIGMPNVNHFCRFFRRETGFPAGEWRARP